MLNFRNLFVVIVSNMNINNNNNNKYLSDIRTYYNTISINNKIRIDIFSNIL